MGDFYYLITHFLRCVCVCKGLSGRRPVRWGLQTMKRGAGGNNARNKHTFCHFPTQRGKGFFPPLLLNCHNIRRVLGIWSICSDQQFFSSYGKLDNPVLWLANESSVANESFCWLWSHSALCYFAKGSILERVGLVIIPLATLSQLVFVHTDYIRRRMSHITGSLLSNSPRTKCEKSRVFHHGFVACDANSPQSWNELILRVLALQQP